MSLGQNCKWSGQRLRHKETTQARVKLENYRYILCRSDQTLLSAALQSVLFLPFLFLFLDDAFKCSVLHEERVSQLAEADCCLLLGDRFCDAPNRHRTALLSIHQLLSAGGVLLSLGFYLAINEEVLLD